MNSDNENKDIIVHGNMPVSLPQNVSERSIKRNKKTNTITATEISTEPNGETSLKQVTIHPDGSKDLKMFSTPQETIKNKESRKERVRQIRNTGLNQTDTGKAIDRSQSTISLIENTY